MNGWSNRGKKVSLGDGDLMVVGAEMLRYRTGKFRFRVLRLTKDDREGTRAYSVSTQDGDQTAGVDSAGKKNSYRHIAHQLQPHGFVEQLRDLAFEFNAILCAGIGRVIVAFTGTGIDQVPILP